MNYFTRKSLILLELRILEVKQQELIHKVNNCDLEAIEETLVYTKIKIRLFQELNELSISDN